MIYDMIIANIVEKNNKKEKKTLTLRLKKELLDDLKNAHTIAYCTSIASDVATLNIYGCLEQKEYEEVSQAIQETKQKITQSAIKLNKLLF